MSNLQEAIQEMRNMREAYDQIAGAAEAYNTGKIELAENITAKGIPASATETLPELAGKVSDIQQRSIDIISSNWYGAQIGAGGDIWDLYSVLAEMKNRWIGTDQYAALIVCGFDKGYDSLQLSGADAYYTCDGDFYGVASTVHIWHDNENGKTNRWVCYLYIKSGANLNIMDTDTSPRSMYIGGHIGKIEYFVNGRLEEFVCGIEDTDIVDFFYSKNFTQAWNRTCVIRNVGRLLYTPSSAYSDNIYSALSLSGVSNVLDIASVKTDYTERRVSQSVIISSAKYIRVKGINNIILYWNNGIISASNATVIVEINDISNVSWNGNAGGNGGLIVFPSDKDLSIRSIYIDGLNSFNQEILQSDLGDYPIRPINLIDLIVGAFSTNLRCKKWDPTNVLVDATKKAQLIDNIKNHILARVSDRIGLSQLVFTISTNMYNNIASEQIEWQGETMSLADAFLTKNWLLAGA